MSTLSVSQEDCAGNYTASVIARSGKSDRNSRITDKEIAEKAIFLQDRKSACVSLRVLVFLTICFFCGGGIASGITYAVMAASAEPDGGESSSALGATSYLFVQQGTSGTLQSAITDRTSFQLAMHDARRTLIFSDRPVRKSLMWHTKHYADSFTTIFSNVSGGFPNAVLVTSEPESEVVLELLSCGYDVRNGTLTYYARAIDTYGGHSQLAARSESVVHPLLWDAKTVQMQAASLFVDDWFTDFFSGAAGNMFNSVAAPIPVSAPVVAPIVQNVAPIAPIAHAIAPVASTVPAVPLQSVATMSDDLDTVSHTLDEGVVPAYKDVKTEVLVASQRFAKVMSTVGQDVKKGFEFFLDDVVCTEPGKASLKTTCTLVAEAAVCAATDGVGFPPLVDCEGEQAAQDVVAKEAAKTLLDHDGEEIESALKGAGVCEGIAKAIVTTIVEGIIGGSGLGGPFIDTLCGIAISCVCDEDCGFTCDKPDNDKPITYKYHLQQDVFQSSCTTGDPNYQCGGSKFGNRLGAATFGQYSQVNCKFNAECAPLSILIESTPMLACNSLCGSEGPKYCTADIDMMCKTVVQTPG